MRVLIGVLLLGLCARGSAQRLEAWRSDQALWDAAARTAPMLPRPALNLGHAYGQQGQWPEAIAWTERAILLTGGRPPLWLRGPLCHQVRWLSVFSDPPDWSLVLDCVW